MSSEVTSSFNVRSDSYSCRQRLSLGADKEKSKLQQEFYPQSYEHEKDDNQDEESFCSSQASQEQMGLLANQYSSGLSSSGNEALVHKSSWLKNLTRHFGKHRQVHPAPSSFTHPPEKSERITGTAIGSIFLYSSLILTLLSGPQLGWEITQLNLTIFHNHDDCARRPVVNGTCTIFPGHSNSEWILAVVAWVIGAAFGSLCTNIPAEKFGRRCVIFTNALLMLVGSACQTFAPIMPIFVLGRLFSGLCSGSASTIASIYLGEISPEDSRATFVVAFQVAGSAGLVAITGAHFAVTGSATSWRWIMMIPMCIAIVQLVAIPIFLVESPKWLIKKERLLEAKFSFEKLYRHGCFEDLQSSMQIEKTKSQPGHHSPQSSEHCTNNIAYCLPIQSFFRDCMSPRYRAQFLMSIVLCLARQLGGVSAVFYYSSSIFTKAGISDPRLGNLILALVNLMTVASVCSCMKNLPRRKALLFGISGMIIASSCMTIALARRSAVAICCTALYVICNCASLGTLPFLVSAEILPEHLRGMGLSFTSSVNWLANLSVGVVFPFIARALGSFSFVPFICLLVSFWLAVFLFLPETKDLSYEDIEAAFPRQKVSLNIFKKYWTHDGGVGLVYTGNIKQCSEGGKDTHFQEMVQLRRASLESNTLSVPHRSSTVSRMA